MPHSSGKDPRWTMCTITPQCLEGATLAPPRLRTKQAIPPCHRSRREGTPSTPMGMERNPIGVDGCLITFFFCIKRWDKQILRTTVSNSPTCHRYSATATAPVTLRYNQVSWTCSFTSTFVLQYPSHVWRLKQVRCQYFRRILSLRALLLSLTFLFYVLKYYLPFVFEIRETKL